MSEQSGGPTAQQERAEDEQPPVLPPAGWFSDPEWPGWLRWWDGEHWTEHRTRDPATVPSATSQSKPVSNWAVAAVVSGALGLVVVAVVCALVAKRRIRDSNGKLGGEGLANAGLGFAAAYAVVLVVVFATGVLNKHQNDAAQFTGPKRAVATVVDRFERAVDENKGDEVCADLLTAEFVAKVARGAGTSCAQAVVDSVAKGAFQAEIKITAIQISGSTATVRVKEGGDPERWTLRRVAGAWRIDAIEQVEETKIV